MELEKQVCSCEQAIKLRELGVTQNSLWYWVVTGTRTIISDKQLIASGGLPTNKNVYSAFTVAELGNMLKMVACRLPAWCKKPKHLPGEMCWDDPLPSYETTLSSNYEATARGNLLVYLIEYESIAADWLNR